MKAIVQNAFGSPALPELKETDKGIHTPDSGHAGIGYAVKALVR